jgi:hypothetical protein
MDPQTQMDISNLSEADKKDLSQILQNESQKTTIQQCELALARLSLSQSQDRVVLLHY